MFTVTKPADANYTQLNTFVTTTSGNFDYSGFAAAFNALEVGAILSFPFRGGKLASLRNSLVDRDLVSGIDFVVNGGYEKQDSEGKPDINSTYTAAVKRITDKLAGTPKPKPKKDGDTDAGEGGEGEGEGE